MFLTLAGETIKDKLWRPLTDPLVSQNLTTHFLAPMVFGRHFLTLDGTPSGEPWMYPWEDEENPRLNLEDVPEAFRTIVVLAPRLLLSYVEFRVPLDSVLSTVMRIHYLHRSAF